MTTAREHAETALNPLRAVAWALLDLADAIREGHEPTHQILYPEEPE